MNPALIPALLKVGETILDRLAGSKKAAASSAVGVTTTAATAINDPGAMLFPANDEYATALNALAYLVSFLFIMYRDRK